MTNSRLLDVVEQLASAEVEVLPMHHVNIKFTKARVALLRKHVAGKADPQAKAVVRASTSPTREKLFFKISFPSKNFKNANTQPERKTFGQLVAKLNIDKGCKTRTTRTPGHNIVYKQ